MSAGMAAQPASLLAHPRASWLDPNTGGLRQQGELLRDMAQRRVVLLGERHDIAEIHRWQMHVCAYLHGLHPNLAVGFEMFPRRLQPVLDRWVAGELDTSAFLVEAEWETVWGFPPEIYLPLFHFCRQQNVRMLALNCHRPLVTRVGVEGWDAIPEEDRDGLTPSAPATSAYRRYLWGLGAGPRSRTASGPDDPAFARFWRAQQCWDRAFACNIARALEADPTLLVVGIIGRGHLEFGHGTPYQLADLGFPGAGVLLPNEEPEIELAKVAGMADALFRLDRPDPPAERKPRPASSEPAAQVAAS